MIKIECFIPEEFVKTLRDELNKIGALTVDGLYDSCMAVSRVTGSWRPLAGSNPYSGTQGQISEEVEAKVEFTCKREIWRAAVQTIKEVHPYETPVINVIPLLCEEDG